MKCLTNDTLIVSNFFEDSISIVNLTQGREIQKIKLCDSGHHFSSPQFGPHHMALYHEKRLLYVPNSWNNSISIIDLVKIKIIDTICVGSCPSQVILCPKYGYIYVANTDSNSISVLNMDRLSVIVQLSTGEMPHGMAITNDEERIFVGNYGSGEITEILTRTNERVKNHKVQCNPWHLRIDNNGEFLYVVNYSNQFNRNGKIYVYNVNNLEEKRKIYIGKTPVETICDNKNKYLYVTDFDMDYVHIYDLKNNRYDGYVKVNPMPHGIGLDNKKGRLFVTSMGRNTVDIIDIRKRAVIKSILVGKEPTSIVRSAMLK